MVLDLLFGRHLTLHRLGRRVVLLQYSAAGLRRQGAAIGMSELDVRFGFGWAIGLTRRPKSTLAVLPCGSSWGVPAGEIVSIRHSTRHFTRWHGHLTISSTLPLLRVNGALTHRKICRKHSMLTTQGNRLSNRGSDAGFPRLMKTGNRWLRVSLEQNRSFQAGYLVSKNK